MTLWAYIPGVSIVRVGELPASDRTLRTGREVVDLAGVGARWRRACGWYDLDSPTLRSDLAGKALAPAELSALLVAASQARARRDSRQAWRGEIEDTIAARNALWGWIDDNASRPVVGSQTAGANWPSGGTLLALLQQTTELQWGMTELMVAVIAMSEAFEVLLPILADLIAATDITPPPPR